MNKKFQFIVILLLFGIVQVYGACNDDGTNEDGGFTAECYNNNVNLQSIPNGQVANIAVEFINNRQGFSSEDLSNLVLKASEQGKLSEIRGISPRSVVIGRLKEGDHREAIVKILDDINKAEGFSDEDFRSAFEDFLSGDPQAFSELSTSTKKSWCGEFADDCFGIDKVSLVGISTDPSDGLKKVQIQFSDGNKVKLPLKAQRPDMYPLRIEEDGITIEGLTKSRSIIGSTLVPKDKIVSGEILPYEGTYKLPIGTRIKFVDDEFEVTDPNGNNGFATLEPILDSERVPGTKEKVINTILRTYKLASLCKDGDCNKGEFGGKRVEVINERNTIGAKLLSDFAYSKIPSQSEQTDLIRVGGVGVKVLFEDPGEFVRCEKCVHPLKSDGDERIFRIGNSNSFGEDKNPLTVGIPSVEGKSVRTFFELAEDRCRGCIINQNGGRYEITPKGKVKLENPKGFDDFFFLSRDNEEIREIRGIRSQASFNRKIEEEKPKTGVLLNGVGTEKFIKPSEEGVYNEENCRSLSGETAADNSKCFIGVGISKVCADENNPLYKAAGCNSFKK